MKEITDKKGLDDLTEDLLLVGFSEEKIPMLKEFLEGKVKGKPQLYLLIMHSYSPSHLLEDIDLKKTGIMKRVVYRLNLLGYSINKEEIDRLYEIIKDTKLNPVNCGRIEEKYRKINYSNYNYF